MTGFTCAHSSSSILDRSKSLELKFDPTWLLLVQLGGVHLRGVERKCSKKNNYETVGLFANKVKFITTRHYDSFNDVTPNFLVKIFAFYK